MIASPDPERELAGLLPLVAPSLRARVQSELTPTANRKASHNRRKKFLHSLYHVPPFDGRYVTVLSYEKTWPEAVHAELVARGAPRECYVISDDSTYDGSTMPLRDALDGRLSDGTILICIPGRLAYYVGEEGVGGGYQWIVERRT